MRKTPFLPLRSLLRRETDISKELQLVVINVEHLLNKRVSIDGGSPEKAEYFIWWYFLVE